MSKIGFNIEHMNNDEFRRMHTNKPLFDTFLVNPNDRPSLFERERLVPPFTPDQDASSYVGDLFGMRVHTSELVPPGRVIMIEQPKFEPFTYKPISSPWADRIYSELDTIIRSRIASAFGVPGHPWGLPTAVVQYRWQRNKNEMVFAWGERLSAKGLLDDPQIRWEFQKAVWKSIGLKLKGMVGR